MERKQNIRVLDKVPENIWFQKNVPYSIGVRYFIGDIKGKTLTEADPYVVVEDTDLRDFQRANKRHIDGGLLVRIDEPLVDEDTPNAITDDNAKTLVKNVFALKKALKNISSPAPVQKLLSEAKAQKRPTKTIELIQEKLDELVGDTPAAMQGQYWDSPQNTEELV